MSRRAPDDILAHALERVLLERLGPVRDLNHHWVDWHSATFTGARHAVAFTIDQERAGSLDGIADDNLSLTRGFVADVAMVSRSRGPDGVAVALDVLTLLD